jgi:hypothetical protein
VDLHLTYAFAHASALEAFRGAHPDAHAVTNADAHHFAHFVANRCPHSRVAFFVADNDAYDLTHLVSHYFAYRDTDRFADRRPFFTASQFADD